MTKEGYNVDTSALNIIELTNSWYNNSESEFHKAVTVNGEQYDLERMNFAKRLCADDANLVEVINIKSSEDESTNKLIDDILEKNRFKVMYRKQKEQMAANGTVGCYVRVKDATRYTDGSIRGGEIMINYCDALGIAPLTVINDEIIECAFSGISVIGLEERQTVVIYTIGKDDIYICKSVVFDENGKEIKDLTEIVKLGEVKPFAIMRSAEVNNLDMIGYGYPKLLSAIPNLEILDLSYTMWKRDLEKSDKIILINENICERDEKGKPIPPTKAKKKIFVQVGQDRLPDRENALWQEYNPTVRIGEISESIEKVLAMLSTSFGYGTKKYTFEQGRIVTATEYVGERQDAMQEINKQRDESINYIKDIINAIRYFYNVLNDGSKISELDIEVDFDDSYVEDKTSVAESLRNDALSFGIPNLQLKYFMKKYNLSEDEAKEWIGQIPSNDEGDEGDE